MNHWNDFLGPLIFLSDLDKYTLALGLRFFQGQHRVEWALLMAASLVVLSPCIVLFFIAQKKLHPGNRHYRRQRLNAQPFPFAPVVARKPLISSKPSHRTSICSSP